MKPITTIRKTYPDFMSTCKQGVEMLIEKLFALALISSFLFLPIIAFSQGVAMNTDGSAADNSAILDIKSTTQGMLTPRMTLAQRALLIGSDGIAGHAPAEGCLIYQTDNTPGYYYYNGTVWIPLFSNNSGWSLTGNLLSGSEFLGSTNAQPVIFKTDNTEWMRILSTGNVGIGTSAPFGKLDVTQNSASATALFSNYGNDNNIFVGRAQGTYASPAVIGSDGNIFNLIGLGYDGANFQTAAQIAYEVDAVSGVGDMPGRILFSTTPDGSATLTERMKINSTGNIRINDMLIPTTNPDYTDNPYIKLSATGGFAFIGSFNRDNSIVGNNGRPGHTYYSGVGALAIGMNRTAGTSGVDFWNTTSPGQATASAANCRGFYFRQYDVSGNEKLLCSIDGNGVVSAYDINATHSVYAAADIWATSGIVYSGNAYITNAITANTVVASTSLHSNGNVSASGNLYYNGSVLCCSDLRFKKDIKPINCALDNVMKIQGVTYNWKKDKFPDKKFSSDLQYGVIAQDLEKIFPELVLTASDGYKAVDYSKLTPILVEAIKEQQKIIVSQQSAIDNLTKEIENVKQLLGIEAKK